MSESIDNKKDLGKNIEPENPLLKPLPKDSKSENIDDDIKKYGCYVKDGQYCIKEKTKSGKDLPYILSNFTMKILFHFVDGSQNTLRLILLQRKTGTQSIIKVLSSELKKESFETILKSFNCSFLGNGYQLNRLIAGLMDDNKTEAIVIETLGYSPHYDMYCFSNGLYINDKFLECDSIGIIEHEDKIYYLPSASELNKSDDPDKPDPYIEQRKFKYIPGRIDFSKWSKLVYQAYDLNGSIGICFLINSLFRDIIFKELGFFPFLFMFGSQGVGKTTFNDSFLKLFGLGVTGKSIDTSTEKSIARSCSQKRNALVFLKEYPKRLIPVKVGLFKNGYDGVAYSIAQKTHDNKTLDFYFESGINIDGNSMPTNEAPLFDRFIILSFSGESFTDESENAYHKLIDESYHGFGKVLLDILKHREFYKEHFRTGYRDVYNQLKNDKLEFEEVKISTLPERNIKHIAFLLTPYRILYERLRFPFSFDELSEKVLKDAIEKNEQIKALSDVNIFWDAINSDRSSDFPKIKYNKHYVKDDPVGILFIKLGDVVPIYIEYCKKNEITFMDKTSIVKLLTELSCFIPSHLKGRDKSHNKKGFGACYQFSYTKSNEEDFIIINDKEVYL